MVLTRIGLGRPVVRLRGDADRWFNNLFENTPFGDSSACCGRRSFPALNVWEDAQTLYAEAEIPGLTMDEIEVLVHGEELTIKGERKGTDAEDVTYHRRERGVGSFSRVLRLPVAVDAENVSAQLRDGLLTITLPKAQAALPRKIEVK